MDKLTLAALEREAGMVAVLFLEVDGALLPVLAKREQVAALGDRGAELLQAAQRRRRALWKAAGRARKQAAQRQQQAA